jgi:hypothetical protein
MSILSSSKSRCRFGVDLGDSTYIIHKRIFKRSYSLGLADVIPSTQRLPKMALITRFQAGFGVLDIIETERWRFTNEVQ